MRSPAHFIRASGGGPRKEQRDGWLACRAAARAGEGASYFPHSGQWSTGWEAFGGLMADPRPRSCQKGGGNSGLLGRSSLWTPDGARGGSCGWLWREVDPLRVVLRGNHWLPAPCVSSSGWLTASAKGTGVPGLSDVPSLLSASVPSALALAANQLTNAAVQGCTQHVSSASETEGGAEQQTRTSLNGRAGNA
jgi:hypothetical protein